MVIKWVINGGFGFIGSNLITAIINKNKNSQIIILDNLSTGSKNLLNKKIDIKQITKIPKKNQVGVFFKKINLKNFKESIIYFKNADIVVHLAADAGVYDSVKNPKKNIENNLTTLLNALEFSRIYNVKKFIFASSNAAIGNAPQPISEKTFPIPFSPYGASKLSCEYFCNIYFETYKLNTVVLRFGNVYGPGSINKDSIIAKFIKKILRKQICYIYGSGNQRRDFIYINDLVKAILLSTNNKIKGQIFQISSGKGITINDLTKNLKIIFKEKYNLNTIFKHSSKRRGDVFKNFSNVKKSKLVLKWSTKIHIKEGLERTIEYFLNNEKSKD